MSVSLPQSVMGSMVQALVNSSENTQSEVEKLQAVFDQHRNESSALNSQLSNENQKMQVIIAELQSQLAISNRTKDDRIQALENRVNVITAESELLKQQNFQLQSQINALTTTNHQLQIRSNTLAQIEARQEAYNKQMDALRRSGLI